MKPAAGPDGGRVEVLRWGGVAVQPGIVTFAKGVTSGYIPLGGLVISGEIRDVLFETGHDHQDMALA
jgi:adenosylmethionine-8-amino-7-oxononanoate aminotransferase